MNLLRTSNKYPFIYVCKTAWDIIKELLSIVILYSACRRVKTDIFSRRNEHCRLGAKVYGEQSVDRKYFLFILYLQHEFYWKCKISELVLNTEVCFFWFAFILCSLKHEYGYCSVTTDCVPLRAEDDWQHCVCCCSCDDSLHRWSFLTSYFTIYKTRDWRVVFK